MASNKLSAKRKKVRNIRSEVLGGNTPLALQKYLWPVEYPKYFLPYKKSPELMTILHTLFSFAYGESIKRELTELDEGDLFQTNPLSRNKSVEARINDIFGTECRKVISYKAICDFTIVELDFTPMAEVPLYQTPEKARKVYKGDLLLVRIDRDDVDTYGSCELQVLTSGLFNSADDDFRCFTGSVVDVQKNLVNAALEGKPKHKFTRKNR